MIIIQTGDIFQSDCSIITLPVNTVGVMGAGLVKNIPIKHHDFFIDYKIRCRTTYSSGMVRYPSLKIGEPYYYILPPHEFGTYKAFLVFPTKIHWKNKSQLEYITSGLKALKKLKPPIRGKIAIPLLGAGLGGLNQKLVIEIIIKQLKSHHRHFVLFVPKHLKKYSEELLK